MRQMAASHGLQRPWLVAVASCCAIAGLGLAAPTAAVAADPGLSSEIMVPIGSAGVSGRVGDLAVGDAGAVVTHGTSRTTVSYAAPGASETTAMPGEAAACTSLVGIDDGALTCRNDDAGALRVINADLSTGASRTTAVPSRVIGSAGTGWVELTQTGLARHEPGAAVSPIELSGASVRTFEVPSRTVPGVGYSAGGLADAQGAAVVGTALHADGRWLRSVLHVAADGSTTVLATSPTARVVGLSPHLVAWVDGARLLIGSRAGGPVSALALPRPLPAVDVALTDQGVAYVEDGATVRSAALSGGLLGPLSAVHLTGPVQLAGSPDGSMTVAASSTTGVSSLLRLVPGQATTTTLASLEPGPASVRSLALAGGRLLTVDDALASKPGDDVVHERRLTEDGRGQFTVGSAKTLPARGVLVSASAARTLVLRRDGTAQLLDHGALQRVLSADGASHPVAGDVSGSSTVLGARVYRDGQLAATLPGAVTTAASGSQVVWSDRSGAVRWRDVAATSARPDRVLLTRCGCRRTLAFDGNYLVAASSTDDSVIVEVSSRTVRAAPSLGTGTPAISDGVVVWFEPDGDRYRSGTVYALDLRTPGAPALNVGRTWLPAGPDGQPLLAVDRGVVAWMGPDRMAHIARLPFPASAVRTLTTDVSGVGLSPNGDGRAENWSVATDLTGPGSKATLTISADGSAVRVLSGSAVSSSVRDLVWDGRDQGGVTVDDGRYSWRLDITVPGAPAVSSHGVLRVQRTTKLSVQVTVPAVAATATAYSDRVPVSWTPIGAGPAGQAASYDVRQRVLTGWGPGRVSPSRPTVVAEGITARSLVTQVPATSAGRAVTEQVSVRAKDNLGNFGPWSPWASSAVALDELAPPVRPSVGWRRAWSQAAYGHHYLTTTRSGASVTASGVGKNVTVLGMRCPSCGSVRVTVNDRSVVVSAYARVTKHRQVLATFQDLRGRSTVSVASVPQGGRSRVAVDAIAFGLG